MKILESEITSYKTYLNRRQFIKSSIAISFSASLASKLHAFHVSPFNPYIGKLNANDQLNSFEEITTYNNFYEFGSGKSDPSNFSNQLNNIQVNLSTEQNWIYFQPEEILIGNISNQYDPLEFETVLNLEEINELISAEFIVSISSQYSENGTVQQYSDQLLP